MNVFFYASRWAAKEHFFKQKFLLTNDTIKCEQIKWNNERSTMCWPLQ